MTVMRGLDPRIHQKKSLSKEMDCRLKPGNDDLSEWRLLCPA